MSAGKKILLVLIIIFGGAIAFLSYDYLSTAKTNIFLFKGNYEAGTPITKDMFSQLEVDYNMVTQLRKTTSEGAKYVTQDDMAEILSKGDYLGTDVYQYTPFMTSQIATIGGSTVERRLSNYKTAITIPVNNISGVSSEINAGARINIYASYSTDTYQVVQLLFQNVKILDVLATGNEADGYNLSGFTIEIDPEDAPILLHAINNWKIDITLLKSGAYETMTTSSIYKVNTLMLDAIVASSGNSTSYAQSAETTSSSNVSSSSNNNEVTNAQTTTTTDTTTTTTTATVTTEGGEVSSTDE